MLRVEFKGQPYDWFNLDEMGDVVRAEDFAHTLRENIVHYFSVPFDCQAVFDEEGMLVASMDFARALQHVRPFLRVFDIREMPQDFKDQTAQKLAMVMAEVSRAQRNLNAFSAPMGSCNAGAAPDISYGAPMGGRPVSPWPVRDQHPSLADRLTSSSLPSTPPAPMVPQYNVQGLQPMNQSMMRGGMAPLAPGAMMAPVSRTEPLLGGSIGQWQQVPEAASLPQPAAGLSLQPQSMSSAPQGLRQYDMAPRVPWQPDRQPSLFDSCLEVTLTKDMGGERADRFGFANVPTQDGRALQITWIDVTGLLGRWNRMQPDRAVREGDLIIAVNGVSEEVEAMRLQLQFDTIRMLVQRSGQSSGMGC